MATVASNSPALKLDQRINFQLEAVGGKPPPRFGKGIVQRLPGSISGTAPQLDLDTDHIGKLGHKR